MPSKAAESPRTLGALRDSPFSEARIGDRSVKDELRNNLICRLQRGEALFPGIVGYEDTVAPQIVNAVLSRHNFILLGLRGQAKTRLIRMLTALLDVTIADMIGDIDPIKAARRGQDISDELTVHYGLLPRSNRGIFAINELPDLAGKIQVGLFNIMQEGDVQIKGYPIRLPLDLALVFTANPE